jgi:gamma-glutamyl-gamma-aminobutyrate hydrolase PuuD
LAAIYGVSRLDVPTNHHQAIKTAGRGLEFVARAEDGIMEAFEMPDRTFAIGVQWHPERDFANNACLFREFVVQSAKANGGGQ